MLWRVLPSSFGPTSRKGDATGPDWWKNTALVPPGQARSLLSTAFPTGRCAVTKVPCPSVPADAPSSSHGATSNGPQERGPETGEQDAHARGAGSGAFLPARPTASAYFADGEGYLAEWPTRHVWLGRELMQGLGVEDYDLVR